jgi:hypothetical protein
MKTSVRYFFFFLLIFILSGCGLIETYFTYGPDYIKKIEKEFNGSEMETETKKGVQAILEQIEIRVLIDVKNRNTLTVHSSYKQTSELNPLSGEKIDVSSEIQKYPDCDYFDQDNWVCEGFFAIKYEMRKGELFIGGKKMKKNYALKF